MCTKRMTCVYLRTYAPQMRVRAWATRGVYVSIYTETHRSGKMGVNHITYILVYTEHGSGNSVISKIIFFILR